jgi:phosphoribosylanthranilate isomerase
MPSGPGVISEELIAEIAATIPPGVDSFLLTCAQDVETVVGQQQRTGASVLQLCDSLLHGSYADLRTALPGIRIVQVIHVTGPESLVEALAVAPHVHALLLDSGLPTLPVKQLGGTGRVHDWAVSRQIRERCGVPLYLAGGLRAENVQAAVREVHPFGLDLCTGVRSAGKLDEAKLSRFVSAVYAAAEVRPLAE